MSKRSQIHFQVFVYIAAAFLIILILFFSFKVLGSFKKKQREATIVELEQKMKSVVDLISGEYGSVRKTEIRVPADTEKVCFVDISRREDLLKSALAESYPEIRESLEDYVLKNMFLFSKGVVTDSLYVGNLCFDRPYYKCLETSDNLLKILIKGRKDCVDIIKPIPAIKIYNFKNDSKYEAAPVFVIEESAGWMNILRLVPLTMWNDREAGMYDYPYYVYFQPSEQPEQEFLVEYLLNQYQASELRFFSTVPLSLLGHPNVTYEPITNYFSYWDSIVDVVILNTSNEDAALVSSLFASYLISPLVFVDAANLNQYKDYLNGTRVYVIDGLEPAVNAFIDNEAIEVIDYDSEDLRADPELNPYRQLISNVLPSAYIS